MTLHARASAWADLCERHGGIVFPVAEGRWDEKKQRPAHVPLGPDAGGTWADWLETDLDDPAWDRAAGAAVNIKGSNLFCIDDDGAGDHKRTKKLRAASGLWYSTADHRDDIAKAHYWFTQPGKPHAHSVEHQHGVPIDVLSGFDDRARPVRHFVTVAAPDRGRSTPATFEPGPAPADINAWAATPKRPERKQPEPAAPADPLFTLSEAQTMLSHVTAAGLSYDEWLKIGMGVHSTDTGDNGYATWVAWSETSPKHDPTEMRRRWDSFKPDGEITAATIRAHAVRAGWRPPAGGEPHPATLTETKAAGIYAEAHSDTTAWTGTDDGHEHGHWKLWNPEQRRWAIHPGAPAQVLHQTLAPFVATAADHAAKYAKNPAPIRERVFDRWRSRRATTAVFGLAREQLWVPTADWDHNPDLVGHPDGTVTSLSDGRTRNAEPSDRVTRRTGAVPDPDPEKRAWVAARISEIACHDNDLAIWLISTLGQGCIPACTEQEIHLWSGSGGNGKSTLLDAAVRALGSYAGTASRALLSDTNREDHPTHMASVIHPGIGGPRLLSAAEPKHNIPWAEENLKAISGGDRIKARLMRQNEFHGYSVATLVVAVNTLPPLTEVNDAIRRRVRVAPFNADFLGEARDKTMPAQWALHSGALLSLMLDAAAAYLRTGAVKRPAAVVEASARYIASNQAVELFAADKLEPVPVHGSGKGPDAPMVSQHELMASFAEWCHRHQLQAGNARWQDSRGGKPGVAERLVAWFHSQGHTRVARRNSGGGNQPAGLTNVRFSDRHLTVVTDATTDYADRYPK